MRNLFRPIVLPVALLSISMTGAQADPLNAGRAPARIKPAAPSKARPFPLSDARLLDGPFKESQDVAAKYLLSLEPDRFLASFRKEAGLKSKAEQYPGWEQQGVSGHLRAVTSNPVRVSVAINGKSIPPAPGSAAGIWFYADGAKGAQLLFTGHAAVPGSWRMTAVLNTGDEARVLFVPNPAELPKIQFRTEGLSPAALHCQVESNALVISADSGPGAARFTQFTFQDAPACFAPERRPFSRGPVAASPDPYPAIADALVEWDWRMQDGIQTPREPRTYRQAIEKIVRQTEALVGELLRLKTLGPDEESAWRTLCAAGLPPADDASAGEARWLEIHRLRRQIVLANPLFRFSSLLFVKHVPSVMSHQLTQVYGYCARPGGGVFVLAEPAISMKHHAATWFGRATRSATSTPVEAQTRPRGSMCSCRNRFALLLAAGLQMLPEPDKLRVRIFRDMAVLCFDGNVDRDRPTHGFDVIHKLKELLVRVVTVLVGHGWVERQVDRQEAMPLHIVDELRLGHVELRLLPFLSQFAIGAHHDILSGRIDKVGSDLAVFEQMDLAGVIILDGTLGPDLAAGRAEFGPAECNDGIRVARSAGVHLFLPRRIVLEVAGVEPPPAAEPAEFD